jgi:hypothetical protein
MFRFGINTMVLMEISFLKLQFLVTPKSLSWKKTVVRRLVLFVASTTPTIIRLVFAIGSATELWQNIVVKQVSASKAKFIVVRSDTVWISTLKMLLAIILVPPTDPESEKKAIE